MAPNDQNTWGVLAHVSALILGWLGPLIVLLVFGERSEWVRANAKEALNFAITLTIGVVASYVLTLILIGLPLLIACVVLAYVLPILAAVKANRGEFHRYPLTIRFLGRGQ
ncbi:MAG: DUF4870 domain-containing protein [Propionibacterium sp.]|nr:DUF4870 domain-containing protein [Propionibacterium sp.]